MKPLSTRCFLFSFLYLLGCSLPSLAGAKIWVNPPAGLAVTPASGTSVTLTWTDQSADETGFEVERKLGAAGVYAPVGSVGANVTRYVDAGLSPDVTYFYRVRSTNAAGPSTYSNEVSVLLPDVTIPQEVKVSRSGKEPGVPLERQYALSALTQGSNYPVFQAPPCLEGNYFVGWQLYYDLGNVNTQGSWTGYLEVTLLQGTTTLWTKHLQVDLASQTFVATIFHPTAISCDGNYTFTIARKTLTGTVPQGNVYLKQLLYKKNEDVFNAAVLPSLNYSFTAPNALVTWTYPGKAAVAYDVEWVYISGHETFTGATAPDAFRFKEPVRITTAGLSYSHPLYYPSGRIWFRVRAIGYNPAHPDHRINGAWHYGPGTPVAVSNQQPGLNWQLQTTFVEEGKYKKLMSYYDGSSRLRQALTNLSTDQRTVVAEQFYDFEGRKSLDVLPAPVAGNSLAYNPNLNVFTGTDPLVQQHTSVTRKKFHYDNGTRQNSVLANTSGASQYYSAGNPLTMPNKDYLPAANGYVYAQTEYSADNTGRVTNQSGVGEVFKTDGDRTNRAYFAGAAPAELIRLFGSNVGNASHYKKNMMVDPNGQVSVTYQDQEGRTVATALAGEKPANVDALESYSSLSPTPVTVDLTAKNRKIDGASRLEHKMLNTSPNTKYTFRYELAALGAQLQSVGCQDCLYDLTITVTSPKGTPLDLSGLAGNQSPDGKSYQRRNLTAADCANPALLQNLTFDLTFAEVGDYTITKEVRPRELTFEEAKTLLTAKTSIQEKITQIRNSYAADPTECEVCTTGCDDDAQIQEAINEIAALDCENIKRQIIEAILEQNGRQYEVTDADITAHPRYCQYQLCTQNQESDAFDKQLSLAPDWTTAVARGYNAAIDLDPFFDAAKALSGSGHKAAMQNKLNDLLVATVPFDSDGDGDADGSTSFRGTLQDATDPGNTNFYVNANGQRDANGRHLLYYELMGKRATLTVEAYNRQLDTQRWTMFRNLYLETKRKTKLEIAGITACQPYADDLRLTDNLPQTESAIAQWGQDQQITGPVSDQELQMTIANLAANCGIQLSDADKTAIEGHLRNYFNSNLRNFFRLIIKEHVGTNASLLAVKQILAGYNCNLDNVAESDPEVCKTNVTFTVPSNVYTGQGAVTGAAMMSPEGSAMQQSLTGMQETGLLMNEERRGEALLDLERSTLFEESNAGIGARLKQPLGKSNTISSASKSVTTQTTTSSVAFPSQAEYDALIALYNATGGPNWRNNTGWRNAVPGVVQDVSGWYGIKVMWTWGGIIEIDLTGNNLVGHIPPEVKNLKWLERFSLGENSLTGSIPPQLSEMTALEKFSVHRNNLSGSIPPQLGSMQSLKRLHLAGNRLTGGIPPELGNLDLYELHLSHNELTGPIPAQLGQATNLNYLNLENNKLSDQIPVALGNLKQLQLLLLGNNQLSGSIPSGLGYLPAMVTFALYLEGNKFTFTDLIPFIQGQRLQAGVNYAPQELVDIPKTIKRLLGASVTLIATVDRATSPACKYQWFKYVNGYQDRPLTSAPSYEGHTYTIPSLAAGDLGLYYYRITNEGAPTLTLTSHQQKIEGNSIPTRTVNICQAYENDPALNPTLAKFNFQVNWSDLVSQCMARQQETVTFLEEFAIDRMLEEEATTYYESSRTNCLQNLSEKLSYTYASKEYHYTLYYYDQAGNLVQTVPPKGVNPLTPAQVTAFLAGTRTEPAHTLLTRYRYNAYNKLVWQQTPDAGVSEFWYDAKTQLRLSRNAQQALGGKYSYTRYDEQGRVTEVGEMASAETPAQLAARLDDATFPPAAAYALADVTRTHYDLPAPGLAGFEQANLRSRVSWVEAVNEGGATVATYYSYDLHGNVKSLQQQLPSTAPRRTDYVYDLISGKVNYAMYQYGQPDQLLHRYAYDADNRLQQVHTSIDGFLWDKEAEYSYYAHGPLARVETGHYGVQGSDYYYTLQGWFKGVNMPYANDPGKDGGTGPRRGRDAFAYSLGYYNGDYQPVNGSALLSDTRDKLWTRYNEQTGTGGLYNGNIAWMVTDLPEVGTKQNDRTKGMQAMLYRYDQLNRITAGLGLGKYTAGSGFEARAAGADAAYDTRYTYDPNGNLVTQTRRDQLNALADDLKYSYIPGTNQLASANLPGPPDGLEKVYSSGAVVPDGKWYQQIVLQGPAYVAGGSQVTLQPTQKGILRSGFAVQGGSSLTLELAQPPPLATNYVYDAIGNLLEDKGEGVQIEWTVYGKIRRVTSRTGTVLTYRYDGAGNRVEKQLLQGGTTTTTRYVRDASGNVMATYQASTTAAGATAGEVLAEQPLYGSSRLGLYKGGRLGGQRRLGNKQYELSNHLGNVLAVVSDNIYLDATSTWTKTLTTNDYYPFGLTMPGRSYSSDSYRYGFNGKEKDSEFQNNYDYGFRIYNSRIAKFLSVDPLTKEYPWYTPYQFAGNMPIKYIDLDGLEPAEPGSEKGEYQVANRKGTNQEFGYTWNLDDKGKGSWSERSKIEPSINGTVTREAADAVNSAQGDLQSRDAPRPAPFALDVFASNTELETNMLFGLLAGSSWTNEATGRRLFNHFVSGNGADLILPNGSPLSRELGSDARFLTYVRNFENQALEYFRSNGSLNGFTLVGNTALEGRPGFGGIRANLFLATMIGGTQGAKAEIRLINSREIRVNYTIYDAFGAGRNDTNRPEFIGLRSMYQLQHYRNVPSRFQNLYQPYLLGVSISRFGAPTR